MSADFTPDKKDLKIIPPFKMQVLTNFPYIEADFDALTNYGLLCKIVEYLNKVIANENYVSEEVQGLYNAYVALQAYINYYFDNLDVQEEIDNKLDEMAASGQLADIIAQYLGLAGMFAYDTVEDMKEALNLVNGSKCSTLGFYNVNDGGRAVYKVRTITNDDVVDNATIIELHDNTLVAELIYQNNMNIECFGAKGDDDTFDNGDIFNNAIAKASDKNINLICQDKTYYFSTCIEFSNNLKLIGDNTILQFNDADKGVLLGTPDDLINRTVLLKNITIKMTSQLFGTGKTISEGTAIRLFNVYDSILENIKIDNQVSTNVCNGFWLRENCKNVTFDNCKTIITSGNIVGGSLWLWTYLAESVMENIIVKNCNFTQNTRDEIIGVWGNGIHKNITLENNVITENNINNKVMSFSFRNNTDNVTLINNTINQNSDVQNVINCGTSGKNYQFLDNTFIINKENLTTGNIFLINNNIAKIINNTFTSLAGYLPQIIDVNAGKCIITGNKINNISNCVVNLNRESQNAEILLNNNDISCKISPLYVRSSDHNVIIMDSNNINLDTTSESTHLISFIRNSGGSAGSEVYAQNNKVYGNNVNLVFGVGYANYVLRNNNINATSVYLVKRSDQTYDITKNVSIFENNNIIATTLNDTDCFSNATVRAFNNNLFNGVDITEVSAAPTVDHPYFNNFRRLVPNYKLFNAESSSVLGYKKTGDSSYVAVNI